MSHIKVPTHEITYSWWIESIDPINNKKTTLTWSETIVSFQSHGENISIAIDCGLFQWWQQDKERNANISHELLNTHALILTHAHLDHSGRIPLLVKNGYNKPIYMTPLTKAQVRLMWYDNLKITRQNKESFENRIIPLCKHLNQLLYIKENFETLKANNLSSKDREKIKNQLQKVISNQSYEEAYQNAILELEENNIFSQDDIFEIYNSIPEVLYDEQDIEATLELIKVLNIWEPIQLTNYVHINHYNNQTLSHIIEKVKKWHSRRIWIDSAFYKNILNELNTKIQEASEREEQNKIISLENQRLKSDLEKALDFIWEINQLIKDVEEYCTDIPTFLSNTKREWVSNVYLEYEKAKQILDQYGVNSYEDIQNCLQGLYPIEYSVEVLQKTKSLIKWNTRTKEQKYKPYIEAVKLEFLHAWHIEWSAQALITVIRKQVDNIIEQPNQAIRTPQYISTFKNYLFSGDLGRLYDKNLPEGIQVLKKYKLDYLQLDTTYAGRKHPNRLKSEQEFIDAIIQAPGKVVVPVFSIQRTPEMVILLLHKMLDRRCDYEQLQESKQDIKELYEELSSEETSEFRKQEILEIIKEIKEEIVELKKSLFFTNIVIDAPLAMRILEQYHQEWLEQYSILKPEVQKDLFWRGVIHVLKDTEQQEELYTKKRENRKEVIFTSGGMCEGWAILWHLKHILWNKLATLLFVWYCPENSKWGKIKQWRSVFIHNQLHDIKCKIKDIWGFSGHPDESEIIDYISQLNFNRGADIVLTHGTDERKWMKTRIEETFTTGKNKRKLNIHVPQLWDTFSKKI